MLIIKMDKLNKEELNFLSLLSLIKKDNTYSKIIEKYSKNRIDSNQVFSDLDINKIDENICLSDNPQTGLFLKENSYLISEILLNENKNDWAIDFLLENNLNILSSNENDKAVEYLINNPQKIDWYWFSSNSNDKAVDFILKNIDKYYNKNQFVGLSSNENDKIINYLINNPDKIDIENFKFHNKNKNAIKYCKEKFNFSLDEYWKKCVIKA